MPMGALSISLLRRRKFPRAHHTHDVIACY